MSRVSWAGPLRAAVAAEVAKLCSLPAAIVCAAASLLVGTAIAGALAWGGSGQSVTPIGAVTAAVPLAQVCVIALGVLPMAHESDGSQLRTSLTAVPGRARFVAAKSVAALLATSVVGVLTVAASFAASLAGWAFGGHVGAPPHQDPDPVVMPLAGAAIYLALIGLFAHTISLLWARLAPALGVSLGLVLLAPPLLGASEHARWLPSRAGELLYTGATDHVLTAGTGAAVLAAWAVAVAATGLCVLRRRDI
ncbi:hypothetical protein ACF07D_12970 [Leucobacter sp. NPDC015123]|uniref:hypothetical protein n=1 Tax=Leucobacter sp. NPDC015123 TaxID=3364129 RepID=UPI0036F4803F